MSFVIKAADVQVKSGRIISQFNDCLTHLSYDTGKEETMPHPITRAETYAKLGQMLLEAEVLAPKKGVGGSLAKMLGGNQYDVHLDNVDQKLVNKINEEFRKLPSSASSFTGLSDAKTHLGLDNPTLSITVEDIRSIAGKVGMEISGRKGKIQQGATAAENAIAAGQKQVNDVISEAVHKGTDSQLLKTLVSAAMVTNNDENCRRERIETASGPSTMHGLQPCTPRNKPVDSSRGRQ
jgi:hypothetical protein